MKANRHSGVRSFTLIEIMVVIIIIGILTLVGVPMYRNVVEKGKAQICAANLEALKSAFEIYLAEHNVVPGTLSELSTEEIEKAYARFMRTKGVAARWVAFLEGLRERNFAFASLIKELGKGNTRLLRCPADTRKDQTIISYGINSKLAGMTKEAYEELPATTVIIADSNSVTFFESTGSSDSSAGSMRHRYFNPLKPTDTYANAVTKGGWVRKNGSSGKCSQDCKAKEPKDKNPSRDRVKKASDCWMRCP